MTGPEPTVPPQAITVATWREQLGHIVHDAYVAWLAEQPKPWTMELPMWQDRHPAGQEMCRRIGEAVEAAARERCAQLADQEAESGQKLGLTRIALRAFAQRLRQGGADGAP